MELLITIGLTAGLIWIGWQDFRARQVYLVSYLAVFALLGLKWVLGISPEPGYILTNLLITGMLAVMLALYYLVRYGMVFLKKIRSSIGSGDLLFVPVLWVSFSPVNFVLFLTGSFSIALLYGAITGKKNKTIPLAGILALLLALVLLLRQFNGINPYRDGINSFGLALFFHISQYG